MHNLGLPLPREELEVLFFTLKWEDFQVNTLRRRSLPILLKETWNIACHTKDTLPQICAFSLLCSV